jgi:predicted DCC family thiol-disulfide oxidoreductase YuxK
VLLYDGLCPLCNGWVRFLLARDKAGKLRFAPLQGSSAAALLAELGPGGERPDSVVLALDGRLLLRSEAVLRIGRLLGGPWAALAGLGRWVPAWARDALYDQVAKRRKSLGAYAACPLPPPEWGGRFLP